MLVHAHDQETAEGQELGVGMPPVLPWHCTSGHETFV